MAVKYDANTEAFQMRAQWKKQDNCKKMWFERWSWLLEERKRLTEQSDAIRHKASADISLSQLISTSEDLRSLKPVPLTSTGVIGWLASRPDCRLEIYQSWLYKPPLRLPDAWELPDYEGTKKKGS